MTNHSAYLLAGGACAVAISAALFFTFNSVSDSELEPQSLTPAAVPVATSTTNTASDHASRTREAMRQLEAMGKIDPAKYSSIPPKKDYEKEIIAYANRLDLTDLQKAQALLAKVTSLPPDGQVLALEHAAKLIPDEAYLQLRPALFQLGTTDETREVVVTDVLSRGDDIRMPTLVEMLRLPPNAAQEEIRETLVAYLDEDYGNDWSRWDAAVKKFLSENAE